MRIAKLPILLFMFFCSMTTVLAQHIVARKLMATDGLSNNATLCALRDRYGFLWIGTENGLNCYDGFRFNVYRNMVSTQHPSETNTVMSLYEHGDNILFGGTTGLYVFNRKQNKYYRFDNKTRYGVVVSSSVPKITGTSNGLIWILTLGQGLFIYNPKTNILTQDSRQNSFYSDIKVASDGLVYTTTLSGDLIIFNTEGHFLRKYPIPDHHNDKTQICMTELGGNIWLGYSTQLLRYSNGHIELVKDLPFIGSVHSLAADQKGCLLIGCDNGIFRYSPYSGQMDHLSQSENGASILSDNMVNALTWDSDSTLIVLTRMGGANMLPIRESGVRFLALPVANSQGYNNVRVLARGYNGDIWLGTDHGLYHSLGNTGPITLFNQALLPYEITALMLDGQDLWIGTRHHGIRILNLQTQRITSHTFSSQKPYTIPSNEVNGIYRTSKGEIYVLTSWGINRFDQSSGQFFGYSSLSAMTSFICMQEDKRGWLWASSNNRGLFCKKYHDGSFEMFTSKAIGRQTITVMHSDLQGDLWMATSGGGLFRYNKTKEDFERYDLEGTILHDEAISFIEEDDLGALWVGTTAGIIRISPSRDKSDLRLYGFIHHPDAILMQRSSCSLNGNQIAYGGSNGIYCFSTRQIHPIQDKISVYIHDISFPYATDNIAERQRLGLDVLLYTRKEIELPYSDNSFTLHFSSARQSSMPMTEYEYQLEGFDKAWIHGNNSAEVTYTNLPPGKYVFLLRQAGKTDEAYTARLVITVLPPFYRSTLAYIIYLVLALLAGYYIWRLIQRKWKRRYQQQLDEFQARKEKETFQSKISFFVDLVHEIRTPLSLISLLLERVEGSQQTDENRKHTLSIRRNMNYLLGITNQLLDFQKAESSGITLAYHTTDIGKMLTEIHDQFADAVELQGKKLQLQIPEQPIVTSIDNDKVMKVIMNLVGNALKYSNKEIIMRMEPVSDSIIQISVIDDGEGIPHEEQDKIFDKYYQIGNHNAAINLGTGLGLAYAKMLAQAHHGDLVYHDAPGGGANFSFTLPIVISDEVEPNASQEVVMEIEQEESAEKKPTAATHIILLVEDNEDLLKATANALQPWYKVIKARDGIEALDSLRYHEVDVVVSDVMMPRMDGIQFCQQLKQDINTSHIPVILLSAKTSVEAKVEGMEGGADIYMEKPFSIKQLHLQIQHLLCIRQQFYEQMRHISPTETTAKEEGGLGLNRQDLLFIEKLKEAINANMRDESFSIDILAEQLNLSRSSFYRKIKALTGMTPSDYLKTARMDKAAQLLRDGCRSSEVAEQVGFTSNSYFAKCFRAQFGVLPKDYVSQQE